MTQPEAGVYTLTNVKSRLLVDLIGGGGGESDSVEHNLVQGVRAVTDSSFTHQYWYLGPGAVPNVFVIRNIQSGKCLSLAEGKGAAANFVGPVHCTHEKGGDFTRPQLWEFHASEDKSGNWCIQSLGVKNKTNKDDILGFLCLEGGKTVDFTTLGGAPKDAKDLSQHWTLTKRSLTAKELTDKTKGTPLLADAKGAHPSLPYLQIPNDYIKRLLSNGLKDGSILKVQHGRYDREAQAIAAKNVINKWAATLEIPGVPVLTGIVLGASHDTKTGHAALFFMDDKVTCPVFFDLEKMKFDHPPFKAGVAFF